MPFAVLNIVVLKINTSTKTNKEFDRFFKFTITRNTNVCVASSDRLHHTVSSWHLLCNFLCIKQSCTTLHTWHWTTRKVGSRYAFHNFLNNTHTLIKLRVQRVALDENSVKFCLTIKPRLLLATLTKLHC